MSVELGREARERATARSSAEACRRKGAGEAPDPRAIGEEGSPGEPRGMPDRLRRIAWSASGVLAIATAAAAASGWWLAEPFALALALAVVIAIAAGIGRGRARTSGAPWAPGDAARAASLRAALRIGAIVVLASGTIVALSLEWRLAAAGMAMTVAILSIVGAPAWLAVVSDERERAARGAAATEPPAPPGRGRTGRAPRAG